jgi:hypothetical protein
MEPGLRRCLEGHRATTGWSVALDVETTRDEIVDVILRRAPSRA